MKQSVYYVAIDMASNIFQPTIVEKFDNEVDACSYAALMCRAKKRNYIVIEQKAEYCGASQEN